MITISTTTIALIVGGITILGAIFGVFFYFQKPQLALEKRVSKLEDDIVGCKNENAEIKKLHYDNNESLRKELKEVATALSELSLTVAKLSTIIDERIPKGSPGLTPPGQ